MKSLVFSLVLVCAFPVVASAAPVCASTVICKIYTYCDDNSDMHYQLSTTNEPVHSIDVSNGYGCSGVGAFNDGIDLDKAKAALKTLNDQATQIFNAGSCKVIVNNITLPSGQ